jgi:hypothetical protein
MGRASILIECAARGKGRRPQALELTAIALLARKMLWINAGTDDDCAVVEGRANNRRVWIVRNLP